MRKRGPDGQRIWHDDTVGFAFRRLAIIDLHERSSQPQHLGPLHLTFNGELYNYRELRDELRRLGHEFQTEGDVEVLLHAWAEWGDAALDRCNGMFAFALWDDRERRLVLASDPFGEKPLYYARRGRRLIWASELKALFHDPDVVPAQDDLAVALFLSRGPAPTTGRSFFHGIDRLPAAHVLEWRDGALSLRRYWRPARVEVPSRYDDAVAALRELVVDSIRLRLRSDVPVGTSLSGGIDSSTVVALSAELAGDHTRHAFTARFPGFERDEWRYADAVARAAGVAEHHAVEPSADDLLADLETLVADHEEPVGSLSIYAQWRVMRASSEAGVVVLLDGQGGDELFGGYLASLGWVLRSLRSRELGRELRTEPRLARELAMALAVDHLPGPLRRPWRLRIATPYASDAIVRAVRRIDPVDDTAWRGARGPLRRQLLVQTFETILPSLLRYADRSSMAWGREVRLPYLDRRIAEFALSLPAEFVYRRGVTKRILRDAGRGVVPAAVLGRRDKVGYEPPQRTWLNEPALRRRIGDVLLDPGARARGLYDPAAIEEDLATGAWRDVDGIWRALNVELWLRQLVERPAAMPRPEPATPSISAATRAASAG
jgi:asparagine synthase (glutamine-hydrolysing)